MPDLYKRVAELLIEDGDTEVMKISDLRFTFSISKKAKDTQQSCEVEISNLSEQSREKLVDPAYQKLRLTVKAGYADPGPMVIYKSKITDIRSMYSPPEWTTTITADSGNIAGAAVGGAEPGSEPLSFEDEADGDIFGSLMKKVQAFLDLSIDESLLSIVVDKAGTAWGSRNTVKTLTITGALPKALDMFKAKGVGWFVDDEKLVPYIYGETTGDITIDASRLGSPEKFRETESQGGATTVAYGWNLNTLLWPEVKLMNRVTIVGSKTKGLQGAQLIVLEIRHSGDTHGDDWKTEVKGGIKG